MWLGVYKLLFDQSAPGLDQKEMATPRLVQSYQRAQRHGPAELQRWLNLTLKNYMDGYRSEADVSQLIQWGANVNCVLSNGGSLLYHAVAYFAPDYVRLLRRHGARYNTTDYKIVGMTESYRVDLEGFLRYAEPGPHLEAFIRATPRVLLPRVILQLLRLGIPFETFSGEVAASFLQSEVGRWWLLRADPSRLFAEALPANLARYVVGSL